MIPNPAEYVRKMVEDAAKAASVGDLLPVGSYAREYGEDAAEHVNADNVDGFFVGSHVVNLVVQEAILRVTTVAMNEECDGDVEGAYTMGLLDGAKMVAALLAREMEPAVLSVTEEARIHREFLNIVSSSIN